MPQDQSQAARLVIMVDGCVVIHAENPRDKAKTDTVIINRVDFDEIAQWYVATYGIKPRS